MDIGNGSRKSEQRRFKLVVYIRVCFTGNERSGIANIGEHKNTACQAGGVFVGIAGY